MASYLDTDAGGSHLVCDSENGNYIAIDANSTDLTGATTFGVIAKVGMDWRDASFRSVGAWTMDDQTFEVNAGVPRVHIIVASGNGDYGADATIPDDDAVRWARYLFNTATGDLTFSTSSTDTNDPTSVVWSQLGSVIATGESGAAVANGVAVIGDRGIGGNIPYKGRIYGCHFEMDGSIVNGLAFTAASGLQVDGDTIADDADAAKTWTLTTTNVPESDTSKLIDLSTVSVNTELITLVDPDALVGSDNVRKYE